MSKPRLKIYFEIDNLINAGSIKTDLVTQLIGKQIYEQNALEVFLDTVDNKNKLIAEWRFENSADRDSIKNWALNKAQTDLVTRTSILSARVVSHLCTHDDAIVQDCKTTDYLEWSK